MKAIAILPLFTVALLAADFRAGVARIDITPKTPISMSGYAARTGPSEGAVHKLWAKALALEDEHHSRVVIVTLDLVTVPNNLGEKVAERVRERWGLPRERLMLNCSHTHAGPSLLPSSYGLPEAQGEAAVTVAEYTHRVTGAIVELVGAAIHDLAPARLSFGRGAAGFAMNRREPTPEGIKIGVNRDGPTDHDVPVLKVTGPDGRLRAVLFGYACHNTTLGAKFHRLSGDYAGFAQIELEAAHPGATALFLQLCGADQNPYPRGTLELAEQHGKELAAGVEQVLAGKMRKVRAPVRAALDTTQLTFPPYSREIFEARLNDSNRWKAQHARQMLRLYNEGRPIRSIPYPVQVLRFGRDLTWVALGGEVVVDYSLRAKREFPGEETVVAGYSNDVMGYIPSLRVLREGGYEGGDSMIYDGLPGAFDDHVEETIFAAIRTAMRRVGRPLGQ
jgi:neutral ceramidase